MRPWGPPTFPFSFSGLLVTALFASGCSDTSPETRIADSEAGGSAPSGGDAGGGGTSSGGTSSGGTTAPKDAGSTDASGGATDPDPGPALTPEARAALLSLSPESWPAVPADPTNRFADDPAAAALGERFFFDPSFSGELLSRDNDGTSGSLGLPGETGKVACASCHVPADGFSDSRSFQRQISLGAGWGRRRAPSLLDVGHSKLLMWDGRRDSLFSQIFGPIESVVEMNGSRLYLAQRIFELYRVDYEAVFGALPPLDDGKRFPKLDATMTGCVPSHPTEPLPQCDGPFHGMPGDGAEFDSMSPEDREAVTRVAVNFGKAIGAYERTLACGRGSFDAWIHGDDSAISRAAQRGAALFVGKAGCVSCHSGPFLSDERFHNVGLAPRIVQQAFIDLDDRGAATGISALLADPLNSESTFSDGSDDRLPRAVTPGMEGAFRTPKLRCVSSRPTFMHTGQLGTLEQVVNFFDYGGDRTLYPGTSEIHALHLTALERADLAAFLRTLEGAHGDGG